MLVGSFPCERFVERHVVDVRPFLDDFFTVGCRALAAKRFLSHFVLPPALRSRGPSVIFFTCCSGEPKMRCHKLISPLPSAGGGGGGAAV